MIQPSATQAIGGVEIPPRRPGALRIVSYNVLASRPMRQPAAFGRIFRALEPDFLLLQEWDDADAAEIADWFDEFVPRREKWMARTSAGRGVAIASCWPLIRYGPYRLLYESPAEMLTVGSSYFGPWVAMVGAEAMLGDRSLGLVSLHLTACGDAQSAEEMRRIREAGQIASVLRRTRRLPLVVGGDLNLIGSLEPRERLRSGLDSLGGGDDLPLRFAEPRILGSDQQYTWRNCQTPFAPGRLDWAFYTASRLRVVAEFVLDTERLLRPALDQAGLQKDDTQASDHLPLVVDVEWKPSP